MMGRILSFIVLITTLGVLSPTGSTTAAEQLSPYKHFTIANTSGIEIDPDIAYCPGSGIDLVVYEKDGQIIGQRLNGNGTLIGSPFEISSLLDGEAHISQVDCIAGDPSYFVVSWLLYSVILQWDVQVQAVHGSPQSEPSSQLFGNRLTIEGEGWGFTSPQIACSAVSQNCLLTYTYYGAEAMILARRLEMTDTGIGFLGDEFDFPLSGHWQQSNSVYWNSLDDNYLVLWTEAKWINNNMYHIGFTHVFAEEQGPGMNELQHLPDWLFITGDIQRSCGDPRAAFNPQTGKFLVMFQCSNAEFYDHLELYVQRVDGVGPGKQGSPVQYLNLGDLQTADYVNFDMWISRKPSGENRFMIAMATDTIINNPQGKLYIFAVKGNYDPYSSDQLDSSITKLGEADSYSPAGIRDPLTGRSILVTGDGDWDEPSDIYGYLFAPFVGRFPIIFNND
jgi:hypothetical protein